MGSSHSMANGCGVVRASTTDAETVEKSLKRRRDHPLEWEVLYLRRCLATFVPNELVDLIIEYAEYWPQVLSSFVEYTPYFILSAGAEIDNNAHWFYLTSVPVDLEKQEQAKQKNREDMREKEGGKVEGREEELLKVPLKEEPEAMRAVKKVVFRIWSHNKVWGAGSDLIGYERSWTWFEAAIFPGDKSKEPFWNQDYPLMTDVVDPLTVPPRELGMWKIWHLQSNIRGSEDEAVHEIVWTDRDDESQPTSWRETGSGAGTGFVRTIRPGDIIAVIARARDC